MTRSPGALKVGDTITFPFPVYATRTAGQASTFDAIMAIVLREESTKIHAIPILDSSSHSFDHFWSLAFPELDKASRNTVTIWRIGHPTNHGQGFQDRLSSDQVRAQQKSADEYEAQMSRREGSGRNRIEQMMVAAEFFGLAPESAPFILFFSDKLTRLGVLRIADDWYGDETGWRTFIRAFLPWLRTEPLRTLVASDLDESGLRKALSPLVRALAEDIGSGSRSSSGPRDAETSGAPSDYCRVVRSEGVTFVSQADYQAILDRESEFDMFVDGFTMRVSHSEADGSRKSSKLTPKELLILSEFVELKRQMHPRMTAAMREFASEGSARHSFERARNKADRKLGRYAHLCFRLVRSVSGDSPTYHFDPPKHVKYVLIQPL